MKNHISYLLIIIVFISAVSIPRSYAQQVTEIHWDKAKYYPGDSGQLQVMVKNVDYHEIIACPGYLEFEFEHSLFWDSGEHPILASGTSFTYTFNFKIPLGITQGTYRYYIGWVDFNWIRGVFKIESRMLFSNLLEPAYLNAKLYTDKRIQEANRTTSQSIKTEILLQKARNERIIGENYAQEAKWQDALLHIQAAGNLADEVIALEETGTEISHQDEIVNFAIIVTLFYMIYRVKVKKLT